MGYQLGYWKGWSQASVIDSDIECDWPAAYSAQRIKFINDVFAFWYKARTAPLELQSKINPILDDAGTTGWGISKEPVDLKSLFNHLERHSGTWTKKCERLVSYRGGSETSLFYPNNLDIPVALFNFTEAIEKQLEPLKGYCTLFYNQTSQLDAARQNRDWEQVRFVLEEIQTWSGRAESFLWLAPKPYLFFQKITSYSDALNNIARILTARVNNESLTMDVLQLACNFVPVLGSYYAGMVDMIPNAKNWFSDVIYRYCQRIDAAAAGKLH